VIIKSIVEDIKKHKKIGKDGKIGILWFRFDLAFRKISIYVYPHWEGFPFFLLFFNPFRININSLLVLKYLGTYCEMLSNHISNNVCQCLI